MGRILGNGLTRAAESEQREIELSFWAELLPEGDQVFPTMMARQCGNVLYFTRMKVDVEAANILYEIDVPLMSGEHARDYDAVHMKFVKIDVEHDGSMTASEAMKNFPFPVKRFITDKAEITKLRSAVYRNAK